MVSAGKRLAQAQEVADGISPIEINGQDRSPCNADNCGVSAANRYCMLKVLDVVYPLT